MFDVGCKYSNPGVIWFVGPCIQCKEKYTICSGYWKSCFKVCFLYYNLELPYIRCISLVTLCNCICNHVASDNVGRLILSMRLCVHLLEMELKALTTEEEEKEVHRQDWNDQFSLFEILVLWQSTNWIFSTFIYIFEYLSDVLYILYLWINEDSFLCFWVNFV